MSENTIDDLSPEELVQFIKTLPHEELVKLKRKIILQPITSKEHLWAWCYIFLDIDFPMGVVYPTSTHSPADAMWRIYELMRTGESQDVPQVAMLASRDSYKTLSAAALEVLCMVQLRLPVAHMAAIKPQSAKAIQYVNAFFRKLRPYLEYHKWEKKSDSKSYIEWVTDRDETIYLNIVTATIAGANSEHVPMLFIDEVDVVQDPRALKEAQMIPSTFQDYFPLTVYLSTRKFAGGLMEKTLKQTINAGGEILRWNILDVCERITKEEAQIDKPKVARYISREMPMQNITPEQWAELSDEEQLDFEKFEAYAGIAEHPMLSVMRNFLVDRPQSDKGNLWKPLVAVYNNFRGTDADMAEAQLLCNKPSTSGLVYPRFDELKNVLTVRQAMQKLLGEDTDIDNFEYLKDYLKNLGIPIIGGGDWGWTDYTVLVVIALLPGGEAWLLDCFIEDHLELDDIVKYGSEMQNEWDVDKWYVDQNYPAYLKKLRKAQKDGPGGGAGWTVPKFKKVVEDGITALQSKIVDSDNVRRFYVLDTPNNRFVIDSFGEYRWALDGKGEVIEGKPFHDKDGVADTMDAIRYPAQNVFMKGKGGHFAMTGKNANKPEKTKVPTQSSLQEQAKTVNNKIMQDKINSLATKKTSQPKSKGKKKIFWA